MFLKQYGYQIIFSLLLTLSSSSVYAAFTFIENWQIPDTQLCDNSNVVSDLHQAVGVVQLGQSRKIKIIVPSGTVRAKLSVKSHALEASIALTKTGNNQPLVVL